MGGLLVLALIAGYVWGTAKLVRMTNPAWARVLIVIAAILIPTADAVYGRIKLKQMCEAEGGLHIYRVVKGVEGFESSDSQPTEGWLKMHKYQFVEGSWIDGKSFRLSMNPDGTVLQEFGIAPKSEYLFGMSPGDPNNTYFRIEWTVRTRNTDEVLGRFVNIAYKGGWFERLVGGLYAAGGAVDRCGADMSGTEFVKKVLTPIKQEQAK
jgi:hypothetical protein